MNCIENTLFSFHPSCSVQPHDVCHLLISSYWKCNGPNSALLLPGALQFDQCRGFQWSNVTALGFCPQKKEKKVNVNTDYCQSSTCSQHNSTLGSFSVQQFDACTICSETDWFRNFREYLYMSVYNSLRICVDGCVCVDVPRLMTF